MVKIAALLATLCAIPICAALGGTSDLPPDSVPGSINPAVTQDNIKSTICVPGWTKTVRPPVSYTNKLKAQQMKDIGLAGDPHLYEEDHRVPLECGGNPTDTKNLSPELWVAPYGAHVKDVIETTMHRRVCNGTITLAQCRSIFLAPHDWRDDYDKLFGPRGARN